MISLLHLGEQNRACLTELMDCLYDLGDWYYQKVFCLIIDINPEGAPFCSTFLFGTQTFRNLTQWFYTWQNGTWSWWQVQNFKRFSAEYSNSVKSSKIEWDSCDVRFYVDDPYHLNCGLGQQWLATTCEALVRYSLSMWGNKVPWEFYEIWS